jgi:opacity protein-like surface antigen
MAFRFTLLLVSLFSSFDVLCGGFFYFSPHLECGSLEKSSVVMGKFEPSSSYFVSGVYSPLRSDNNGVYEYGLDIGGGISFGCNAVDQGVRLEVDLSYFKSKLETKSPSRMEFRIESSDVFDPILHANNDGISVLSTVVNFIYDFGVRDRDFIRPYAGIGVGMGRFSAFESKLNSLIYSMKLGFSAVDSNNKRQVYVSFDFGSAVRSSYPSVNFMNAGSDVIGHASLKHPYSFYGISFGVMFNIADYN